MIEININPMLIALGPLVISWHGLLTAAGVLVGVLITVRLFHRTSVTEDDVFAVALPVVLGGIVGARLLFVLENWRLFAGQPLRVLALNEGGISVYGAILGGSLAGALYARYRRLPVARMADRAVVGFLVGQGIGRIGDIINGEHHGQDAPGLPWSVTYTHPDTAGELGVPVHPAVAYEMIYDFVAAAAVYWLLRRQPRDGSAYLAAMIFYAFGRLWVGFYRKDMLIASGLGMAQLIGAGVLVIAVPLLLMRLRQSRGQRWLS
ncbi:MAG: prolipoprotein diacylglyceryl transferase [Chloroflexi bacterium]|nr:prolipoprotein diacylglyceryl transferase [Chloroflexota bacterium]